MISEPLSHFRRAGQRVAIVGIGNDLNGDDAAGVLVARALKGQADQKRLANDQGAIDRLLIIDAGPAPESFTGTLRRFQPDLVILVDAAELGEPAGTIRLFDWQAAQGMSGSTHTLPPSMLAKFLIKDTGCEVLLIGIQPAQLDFDEGLSPQVLLAVDQLIQALQAWIE